MRKTLLITLLGLIATVALAYPIRSNVAAGYGEEGSGLPYDAEVEYIQGDGHSCIATDIIDNPKANRSEVTFSWDVYTGSSMFIFGSYGGTFNYVSLTMYNGRMYRFGNTGGTTPILLAAPGEIHVGTFEFADDSLVYSLDGQVGTYTRSTALVQNRPLTIFTYTGGAESTMFSGRIYRFRVVEIATGFVVADLMPVRFVDEYGVDEGAMFDCVSGKLYRNSGTGSFIIGPELN